MWAIWAVFVMLLILGIVFFVMHNTQQVVDVNLQPLFEDRENVTMLVVVFWSFVGGALLSMFLFITNYIKQSVNLRITKKRIRDLESELAILRNRPIEESAELLSGANKTKSTFDKE